MPEEELEEHLKMSLESIYTLKTGRPVIYFGVGAFGKMFPEIAKDLKSRGLDRVIIVTDPTVWQATKAEQVIKPALESNYYL